MALAVSAHAGVITVDKVKWNVGAKTYDVELSGLPANTAITVNIVKGDITVGETRTRVGPEMTDAMGKWKVNAVDGKKGRFFEVKLNLGGGAGEEIWENIARADSGKWVSRQQKAQKMKGREKGRSNGLPFEAISSVYVEDTDHFQIDDTSPTNTYAFTSLQVYRSLDMSYFGTDQFDSVEAIQTGSLFTDFASDTDDFLLGPTMPGSTPEGAAFLVSPVSPEGYQLIVGEAALWLSDGSLGKSVPFSFAHAVPEPATLILLASGALAICFRRRRS
jgi:hypothetical protein